jgi:hypothetical protein
VILTSHKGQNKQGSDCGEEGLLLLVLCCVVLCCVVMWWCGGGDGCCLRRVGCSEGVREGGREGGRRRWRWRWRPFTSDRCVLPVGRCLRYVTAHFVTLAPALVLALLLSGERAVAVAAASRSQADVGRGPSSTPRFAIPTFRSHWDRGGHLCRAAPGMMGLSSAGWAGELQSRRAPLPRSTPKPTSREDSVRRCARRRRGYCRGREDRKDADVSSVGTAARLREARSLGQMAPVHPRPRGIFSFFGLIRT